ncbi:MAG: hypothetical protein Q7T41_00865 [Candidatus Saccharibacteria bacterium]|nr:hypothetical protein [Candidatus Saccharibacteria bacterium]
MAVDEIKLEIPTFSEEEGVFSRKFTFDETPGKVFTPQGACVVFIALDRPREDDDALQLGEVYTQSVEQAVGLIEDDSLVTSALTEYFHKLREI